MVEQIDKMASWKNIEVENFCLPISMKLMKQQVDDLLMKQQADVAYSWRNSKLTMHQNNETASLQNIKLMKQKVA